MLNVKLNVNEVIVASNGDSRIFFGAKCAL